MTIGVSPPRRVARFHRGCHRMPLTTCPAILDVLTLTRNGSGCRSFVRKLNNLVAEFAKLFIEQTSYFVYSFRLMWSYAHWSKFSQFRWLFFRQTGHSIHSKISGRQVKRYKFFSLIVNMRWRPSFFKRREKKKWCVYCKYMEHICKWKFSVKLTIPTCTLSVDYSSFLLFRVISSQIS